MCGGVFGHGSFNAVREFEVKPREGNVDVVCGRNHGAHGFGASPRTAPSLLRRQAPIELVLDPVSVGKAVTNTTRTIIADLVFLFIAVREGWLRNDGCIRLVASHLRRMQN